MHRAPSNLAGSIAELAVTKEAALNGVGVMFPLTEHGRYDMIFEIGGRLFRVQCKSAGRTGEVIKVGLSSCRYSPGRKGYVHRHYSADEVDAIAAYCPDLDRCYLIGIEEAEGRRAIHLRLGPARNNQQAAINFAADYEFPGAVAQLEERRNGIAKVRGSSPLSSIAPVSSTGETVGAEQFGYAYARFLERAAAGESFLVTRRGRPMARISPPDLPDSACGPEPEAV